MHDTTTSHSGDETERILRARARSLARPSKQQRTADTIEVIEFRLADERYAFEVGSVHDVQPLKELTSLPCTPAFVRGLVNVRGRLVAVIDLKKFFDLPEPGITDLHRVLLLRNDDTELGVLADTVEGVSRIDLGTIEPSLPTLTGIGLEYLRGVTVERVVVLDARAILADSRLVVDEEIAR